MEIKIKNRMLCMIFLLISCAYGPKTEKKSKLNYLNREHYRHKNDTIDGVEIKVLPLFYFERQVKNTQVSGQVVAKTNTYKPIGSIVVALLKSDKIIHKTLTLPNGRFSINENLSNGFYKIKILSQLYTGEKEIQIDGYHSKKHMIEAIKRTK